MSAIYSMTGYASLRGSVRDTVAFTLTIKSVNHRFLDLHLRLPSSCDGLEVQMRRMLKESMRRGHIEVTLQLERRGESEVQLNAGLLDAYVRAFRQAAEGHGLASEPDLNVMLRIPGVMSAESGGSAAEVEGLEGVGELHEFGFGVDACAVVFGGNPSVANLDGAVVEVEVHVAGAASNFVWLGWV